MIDKLKDRVGSSKVYISVDIDVLDPAYAPGKFSSCITSHVLGNRKHCFEISQAANQSINTATGTAEPGGWTSRELLTILDGLSGLKVIGADVVEVAPVYDNPGETTVLAAAEVAYSLITLMVHTPVTTA